jgi:cytochrome c oxidase subunit 1
MAVAAIIRHSRRIIFLVPQTFWPPPERISRQTHFWLTFAGVYCVFMPMHWLGLIAHTNNYSGSRLAAIAGPVRGFITAAILLIVFAQGLFLFNFLWSLFCGERVEDPNPWRATTLEWSVPSPSPADDFGAIDPVVYRRAYEFSVLDVAEDFVPQHLAPEQTVRARKSGN